MGCCPHGGVAPGCLCPCRLPSSHWWATTRAGARLPGSRWPCWAATWRAASSSWVSTVPAVPNAWGGDSCPQLGALGGAVSPWGGMGRAGGTVWPWMGPCWWHRVALDGAMLVALHHRRLCHICCPRVPLYGTAVTLRTRPCWWHCVPLAQSMPGDIATLKGINLHPAAAHPLLRGHPIATHPRQPYIPPSTARVTKPPSLCPPPPLSPPCRLPCSSRSSGGQRLLAGPAGQQAVGCCAPHRAG